MSAPPSRPGAERADGSAIRIGALVPLTRPGWVEAGRQLLAGLELGAGEVNAAGGIGGRPLELVIRDTAADPQRAIAAVTELARLGVAAVAGEYHSVVARAAAARADALGLPFLCSSAVLDALTEEPTEWVARLAPAQSHGWQIYADFLLGAGHRRIAVAAEPSAYWASGTRILRDRLARSRPRPCATNSPAAARQLSSCWPASRSRPCRSSGPSAATSAWPGS
jgi:ABC-type branched-subunit amino acid transport system substrate-binding protein